MGTGLTGAIIKRIIGVMSLLMSEESSRKEFEVFFGIVMPIGYDGPK